MKYLLAAMSLTGMLAAQERSPQPIYRINVVERSIVAVNYGHRTIPTKVDLRGTVLAPEARGEARVESRRGAVEIDARLKKLEAPTKYGREYLTYVLWAITPEGRPTNLGELVLDPDNEAKLKVTSELQAFALIVTAEPYFSVTQPSDVVVMENVIRPDTVGRTEQVSARYELMPRGHYTYEKSDAATVGSADREKLSMDQYEAVLALYQALNAIQIARAAGADEAAGETMSKAERLYENARQLQSKSASSREVVTIARQAAQTAEDARAITAKRRQ